MENLPNQISPLSEPKTMCLSISLLYWHLAILISLFWGYFEWKKKIHEHAKAQNKLKIQIEEVKKIVEYSTTKIEDIKKAIEPIKIDAIQNDKDSFIPLYNFRAAVFGFVSTFAGFIALYAEYQIICDMKISDINTPILILILVLAYMGVAGISGILAEKIYFLVEIFKK